MRGPAACLWQRKRAAACGGPLTSCSLLLLMLTASTAAASLWLIYLLSVTTLWGGPGWTAALVRSGIPPLDTRRRMVSTRRSQPAGLGFGRPWACRLPPTAPRCVSAVPRSRITCALNLGHRRLRRRQLQG